MNTSNLHGQKRLILASGSTYRASQLSQLGIEFSQIPADVDESHQVDEPADRLAERLATLKMRVISDTHPHAIVIGSDQTAVCRDRILGKPGSVARACEQLEWCQGDVIDFHTAVSVWLPDEQTAGSHLEHIQVRMRELSPQEIERYVARDEPLNCAGSFKMESLGISLFESVRSDDPSALIGLPLIGLCRLLRRAGISLP